MISKASAELYSRALLAEGPQGLVGMGVQQTHHIATRSWDPRDKLGESWGLWLETCQSPYITG